MSQPDFVRVCALADVPAGEARPYNVEGFDIAIFNVGDEVFAIENRCPHQGALLSEGDLVDHGVCCHEHGWIIDLDTGMVMNRDNESVATFPVVIKDDEIWVQLG